MDTLGVFAKYWEPGLVKTRIAADLGEQAASQLYQCFVETLLNRLQNVTQDRILVYTPKNRLRDFAESVGDRWSLVPQSEGDLGARMDCFLRKAYLDGVERVVLIGSDSPTIPAQCIRDAFQLLRHYRVVLGPSTDGGYYLIGASTEVPPIFENVDWSTPAVWDQTVRKLQQTRTPFAQLPEWYDVDNADDLNRLNEELKQLVKTDPVWSKLATLVNRVMSSQ